MMSKSNNKYILSCDGTKLYYESYRSPTKNLPTILFVHGIGGDLDAWQYIRNILHKQGFSSIALDIRGHGYSGHPLNNEGYELERFIEDVIAVMDSEKLDKVALVGHSFGAVLSTHIALRHQNRISDLILISGSHLPPSYYKIPGSYALMSVISRLSPPPFMPGHSKYPPGKFHKDIEAIGLARTILRNSLRSYVLGAREILKEDIGDKIKNINIPTLIISGDKDTVFPTHISEFMHSHIPNSQLKIIRDGNHVLVLNNVEETASLISDFLNSIR